MKLQSVVFLFLLFFFLCLPAFGASFVVGSNLDLADQNQGDGTCQTALGPPHNCTLRAAIEEANAHAGADTITFASQLSFSTDVTTIPDITGNDLTIDGSSQWNTTTNSPGVEIGVAGLEDGLVTIGTNTVIKGIFFSGGGTGIRVLGTGARIGGPGTHERNLFFSGTGVLLDSSSRSTTVQHNFFGTRNGENYGADNLYIGDTGIRIFGSGVGAGTVIEHNTIGEYRYGIHLDRCGVVKVDNNLIGKPDDGSKTPNEFGIFLESCNAEITNNTIAYNVNGQIFSHIGVAAGSPVITNNRIGSAYFTSPVSIYGAGGIYLTISNFPTNQNVNITGNIIESTTGDGINIAGGRATIQDNIVYNNGKNGVSLRDTQEGLISGNKIYANDDNGILLNYAQQVVVSNNIIGLGSGLNDNGNGLSGIRIENSSTNNLIGGPTQTSANLIGFNSASGIFITGAGTRDNDVAGNILGSTVLGTIGYFKAGNNHHGIAVYDNAEANSIGLSGNIISPNIILDSGWRGIAVNNSNHNRIVGNKIGTDGDSRKWGNTYSGIQVIGTNNILSDNTIANNGFGVVPAQAGIVIQEAASFNNQISENSIFNNEGKFFEGKVQADNSGNYSWQKQGHFKSAFVTATTTTPTNLNTSEFSLSVHGYVFPWPMFMPAIRGQ